MSSFLRRITKQIFIISNVIIAVMLILASVTPYVHPGKYWLLGVFTLGFPILLLLLLAFFVFWLLVKPRLAFISLIALLTGWNTIRETVGITFSGNKTNDESAYKIMSWNVHMFDYYNYQKKPVIKEKMFSLIREEKPTIACFQEFAYTLPQKDSNYTIDAFQQKLQMPYYFIQSHPLDSIHLKRIPFHYGKAIFSRYPIVNAKHIFNHKGNYNYSFMYADVALPHDTIRVFNIHLQSLYFSNREYEFVENITENNENIEVESKNVLKKIRTGFYKRGEQADTIKKYILQSPHPVIICGDFNDVPGSYAYKTVKGNLQDAFIQKGLGLGRTFNRISSTLRIDNIFADNHFFVEGYKIISKNLSDHFPVITFLKPVQDQ
ncbi:MAG TPA: endonuclease/exonuclease/phosphatase family protein [Chitinophagaceae bacterium]|nr:endonuclease/exonuclease/phosphatase family protein [Chitinophagaceae bacterium]